MTIVYGSRKGQKEQDVNIQDQTTDTLILPLVQLIGTTTLATVVVAEDTSILVVSNAGMTVGDHLRVISVGGDRYYAGTIVSIAGTTIGVDSPMDYPYEVTSEVTFGNINLAVDGSVTPVHFHLRTGSPSTPSAVDITRMLMVCQCASGVNLSLFGDLPALTKGMVFREQNGNLRNIWNIKDNAGLVGISYDWTPFTATNPQQGVDGFSWRLTFGGPNKIGVVLRVESDGQLGIIVQDDLSGLTSLFCILEGHVVTGD